jgi:hypothetical protein
MMYDRPIPGQSLTTEPKNAPYENPPEITNADEALMHHIDHLNNAEAAEDILDFIEAGVDVKTLTEAVMRSAVMQGIHSVDISLTIGPVLHEFIRGIPLAAGVDFEEGFEDKEARKVKTYSRQISSARKMLKKLGVDDAPIKEDKEPVVEDKPTGLMARRA